MPSTSYQLLCWTIYTQIRLSVLWRSLYTTFSWRLTDILRRLLQQAGYQQCLYSSYSFRIGAATTTAVAGLPAWLIKSLGRWSSDAYQTYIQCPPETLCLISSLLARADTSKQSPRNPYTNWTSICQGTILWYCMLCMHCCCMPDTLWVLNCCGCAGGTATYTICFVPWALPLILYAVYCCMFVPWALPTYFVCCVLPHVCAMGTATYIVCCVLPHVCAMGTAIYIVAVYCRMFVHGHCHLYCMLCTATCLCHKHCTVTVSCLQWQRCPHIICCTYTATWFPPYGHYCCTWNIM